MMERLSFGRPDCRRPARGRDDERVRSRHARPAGRQVPHAAVRIPVKDTILTELFVLSCQFECLTTQRVIWVGHVETYRLTLRPKCICLSTPWPLRIGRPTACADSSPARSARRWGSQLNRPSVRTATESTRSSANILPRLFLPARRRPRRAFLLLDAVPSTDSPTRAPNERGPTVAQRRPTLGRLAMISWRQRAIHSAPFRSWLISSNVRPSPSSVAFLLVRDCQRCTTTSFGSSSIP